MAEMTAKLFKNGASQAIRLPKECRFAGKEVLIKRVGDALMIYPKRTKKSPWQPLLDLMGKADADFMPRREQATTVDRRESLE